MSLSTPAGQESMFSCPQTAPQPVPGSRPLRPTAAHEFTGTEEASRVAGQVLWSQGCRFSAVWHLEVPGWARPCAWGQDGSMWGERPAEDLPAHGPCRGGFCQSLLCL